MEPLWVVRKKWVKHSLNTGFGKGKELLFEDIIVNGMEETENFLTKFYGPNYMTPPPLDKRNQHNVRLVEKIV